MFSKAIKKKKILPTLSNIIEKRHITCIVFDTPRNAMMFSNKLLNKEIFTKVHDEYRNIVLVDSQDFKDIEFLGYEWGNKVQEIQRMFTKLEEYGEVKKKK